MHKSGETLLLRAGDYQAKIVTVGAGLAELTCGDRHVVVPHAPDAIPQAHLGKVLMPWPNRIANGCYHFNGERYLPAINDRAGNSAIHGLLAWQNWQVSEQSDSHVTLQTFLPPGYGYPFMLHAEVTWQLDAEHGLHATLSATNIGDTPAPYGAGAHPYLTCNLNRVDECDVTLPCHSILDFSAQPVAEIPAKQAGLDFTTASRIGEIRIDHTFKTLAGSTPWEVRLAHPASGMTTFLHSSQPWLQIYTGEKLGRIGLAVEPMSCPPDAFNSGIDRITLAPGETHTLRFTLGSE